MIRSVRSLSNRQGASIRKCAAASADTTTLVSFGRRPRSLFIQVHVIAPKGGGRESPNWRTYRWYCSENFTTRTPYYNPSVILLGRLSRQPCSSLQVFEIFNLGRTVLDTVG